MTYYIAEIRFNRNKKSKRKEKKKKRPIFRLITVLLISLLFSASIMILSVVASRKPSNPEKCEEKGAVIEALLEFSSEILELPEEAFEDPRYAWSQTKVLRLKVHVAIWQVMVGAYEGAINKLRNDIGDKIEKWIVDPWKTGLIHELEYIIELIKSLCKDLKPPTIVSVLRIPETPNYDENVTIIARVIDNESDVESVILGYQVNSASWINITMNLDDEHYVAEIAPQPYNTTVGYRVYAYDEANNLAISETYSYPVIDSYPPIILYVEHVPASPNYNETVTVIANVTEPPEASGVKNVILWYSTDDEWHFLEMIMQNGVWTATIPGQSAGVNVEFYIEAYDNVGNGVKTSTYDYTVKAPSNLPPVASFSESARTVSTGEVIHFNASDSYDPDGYIESYFWDFGDGTNVMVTSAFVDHAYADDGIYTVTLNVTDNDGSTATATSAKTVLNRLPVASITENATTVLTGVAIRFDASSSEDSDGYIISYLWDFGDGNTAFGVMVNHAYEDNGVFSVNLTVIDDDGSTSSTSAIKTVLNRPPIASFTENASRVAKGEVIHFDSSESYDLDGDIVSYFWDFGDGTNSTDEKVNHAYAEDGNYTVTLTVTDDDGAFSSMSETKIVEEEIIGWPLALLAAIGLGIAALTATLLYGLYRRRRKRGMASNPRSTPLVTLYVPSKLLAG